MKKTITRIRFFFLVGREGYWNKKETAEKQKQEMLQQFICSVNEEMCPEQKKKKRVRVYSQALGMNLFFFFR